VVYHILERSKFSATGIPDAGRRTYYSEYWHTTGGRYHGKMFAARGERRGRLLSDMAGRRLPGRRGGPALLWNARSNTIVAMGFAHRDASKAPLASIASPTPAPRLRALEEQGRLRLAGSTSFAGDEESVEFLVDSETYLPLAERRWVGLRSGAQIRFFNRYLVYERLPLNASSREQLDLDPHPDARCARGTGDVKGRRAPGFPNPCAR
jgi:hypothetical protein